MDDFQQSLENDPWKTTTGDPCPRAQTYLQIPPATISAGCSQLQMILDNFLKN
jgi:hypothetical protein